MYNTSNRILWIKVFQQIFNSNNKKIDWYKKKFQWSFEMFISHINTTISTYIFFCLLKERSNALFWVQRTRHGRSSRYQAAMPLILHRCTEMHQRGKLARTALTQHRQTAHTHTSVKVHRTRGQRGERPRCIAAARVHRPSLHRCTRPTDISWRLCRPNVQFLLCIRRKPQGPRRIFPFDGCRNCGVRGGLKSHAGCIRMHFYARLLLDFFKICYSIILEFWTFSYYKIVFFFYFEDYFLNFTLFFWINRNIIVIQ